MPSGPAQGFRLFSPVGHLQMRGFHCILPAPPEWCGSQSCLKCLGQSFSISSFLFLFSYSGLPLPFWLRTLFYTIHFLSVFKYSIFSCWEFGGEKCVGCWAWAVLWSAMGVCELLQGLPTHFFPLFFSCLLAPPPTPPKDLALLVPFLSAVRCFFHGRWYADGAVFSGGGDECTTCICQVRTELVGDGEQAGHWTFPGCLGWEKRGCHAAKGKLRQQRD